MNQKHVQVLVGPVASGRSTYSHNCARQGMVIVNDDSLVTAVHAGDYQLYDRTLKGLYKSLETQALITALCLNRSVVIDKGTSNTADSRRRWVGLAHSLDVPVVAVLFKDEGPEVHARRRADSDGRGHPYEYWYKVAKYHADHYEPVSPSEGFDLVFDVEWPNVKSGWCYTHQLEGVSP